MIDRVSQVVQHEECNWKVGDIEGLVWLLGLGIVFQVITCVCNHCAPYLAGRGGIVPICISTGELFSSKNFSLLPRLGCVEAVGWS